MIGWDLMQMDSPYGNRDVANAARDVRSRRGATPPNGIESMSIDAESARSGYARTSSGSWSHDGQDHLTELSDDTVTDDPAIHGHVSVRTHISVCSSDVCVCRQISGTCFIHIFCQSQHWTKT